MTGRALRARNLWLASVVLATALACGSSHDEKDGDGPTEGNAGSMSTGTSGFGADPVVPVGGTKASGSGTGGSTTGGLGRGGTVTFGGFPTTGGFPGSGGSSTTGGFGTGGSGVSYPPGSCPAQPPPDGSSCAAFEPSPNFYCYYDAPACRVASMCGADDKWRSGCEAPGAGGEAGASSQAGAAGAEN